jgi:serine/threonine protein kinase
MRITSCPAADELSAFNLGKLPEDRLLAVAEHVAACPTCQSSLHALETQADSLIAGLRQGAPEESYAEEMAFREALEKAKSLTGERTAGHAGVPASAGAAGSPPAKAGTPARPPLERLREYQLLEKLGQGGMGTLYKALHSRLKRVVALKVLPPERMHDGAAVARFQREMEAIGRLNHPHIVRATDAGEVDGTHFLVMDFIEGQTLGQLVQACGPLSVAEACELVRQVALGLQHVHEHGLVHRDVKPSNLLLSADGQVKVLDLGLALLKEEDAEAAELTATGQVMGTFDYMAPEQFGDTHTVDIRADIYSLGCTLYFLLAGKAPFSGPAYANRLSKMRAHADAPAPPIRERRGDVPAGLAAVLARMLAKEPSDRFATPAEVAAALVPFTAGCNLARLTEKTRDLPTSPTQERSVLAGTDPYLSSALTSTTPSSPPAPAARPWRHPRRWLAVAVAAAALVGGVVLLGAVFTLRTKHGTLVVTVSEPDVKVLIDGEEKVTIESTKVGRIELVPGEHKLTVKRGDEELYTESFTLKSGGEKVIDAHWTPSAVAKPVGDTWLQAVAALPAEKQVEVVAAKLKELNPGFDGNVTPKVEGGVLTGLRFVTDEVTDLAPLRALPALKSLECSGSAEGKGKLADLSPLHGMQLNFLKCAGTQVSDLSPLHGMPLGFLDCQHTQVKDLTPLKDLPLYHLFCDDTEVADLTPLQGMPHLMEFECGNTRVSDLTPLRGRRLTWLRCYGTGVSELAPLHGMPLTELDCSATKVVDLSPLHGMPLVRLRCQATHVSDLSPLEGIQLKFLYCGTTEVADLSPLKGMPLIVVDCRGTRVTDLTPLVGMPLKEVRCDFKPERDTAILRSIKTLEAINLKTAAEFWKEAGGN